MCLSSRSSPFSEIPKVLEAQCYPSCHPGCSPVTQDPLTIPEAAPGNAHRPQDGPGGEGHKLSQAEVCKPDLAMALAGTCQPPVQRAPRT